MFTFAFLCCVTHRKIWKKNILFERLTREWERGSFKKGSQIKKIYFYRMKKKGWRSVLSSEWMNFWWLSLWRAKKILWWDEWRVGSNDGLRFNVTNCDRYYFSSLQFFLSLNFFMLHVTWSHVTWLWTAHIFKVEKISPLGSWGQTSSFIILSTSRMNFLSLSLRSHVIQINMYKSWSWWKIFYVKCKRIYFLFLSSTICRQHVSLLVGWKQFKGILLSKKKFCRQQQQQ